MTFAEMVARVKVYSGERDDVKAGYAVNDARDMILNAIRWPFLRIPGTALILIAGTQKYSLPSDFKFPGDVWYRNSVNGTPYYLKPTTRKLDTVNPGVPQYFRVKKAAAGSGATKSPWVVELECIPDTGFVNQYPTMEFDYFYKPAAMSGSDVSQFDEADDQIIVWGAVTLLTAKQDDAGAFQMFATMWKEGYKDIIQNAIDFYGEGVVVGPGSEITDETNPRIRDYGRVS